MDLLRHVANRFEPLSYCWEHRQEVMLIQSSVAELKRGIRSRDLDATICHAVFVTYASCKTLRSITTIAISLKPTARHIKQSMIRQHLVSTMMFSITKPLFIFKPVCLGAWASCSTNGCKWRRLTTTEFEQAAITIFYVAVPRISCYHIQWAIRS